MRAMRASAAAATTICWLALGAVGAHAQTTPDPTSPSELERCAFVSYDGGDTETCTLQVTSFDGAPLDVDITRPANGAGGKRHKLIAMLHGFGGDKREYESTTDEGDGREDFHWNSHWFAKHGYYVITYTARGFFTARKDEAHTPATPSGSSCSDTPPRPATSDGGPCDEAGNGKIRLKSRDFEIRDTRFLSQLTATAFADEVDPERASVTGLSYGGGESWTQASQPRFDDFPGLKDVRLQVAVPRYSWTDLGYGLAPNGHPNPDGARGPGEGDPIYESSIGRADSDTGDGFPIGVPKSSYIGGFFASGRRRGTFQEGCLGPSQCDPQYTQEGPISISSWNTRVFGNDPFSPEDPIVRQIRQGLTEFRSSYYQDKQWKAQAANGDETAIYAIGGWTDDLFPAVEQFRQYKFLKRLDPRWPVEVEMADVGHPRAQNEPETWRRLNAQAFQFMQSQIDGAHRQTTTVASQPTTCADDGDPDRNDTAAQRLTAQTPEGLAAGELNVGFPGATLPPGSGTGDPDGIKSDPVVGGVLLERALPGECVVSQTQQWPGRYTAMSAPLREATTYVGLGSVRLNGYSLAETDGAATVNTRVWDVAPNGTTTLMTRGTYRLDTLGGYDKPAGAGLRLPLFGNHWQLKPGHRLRLDLMQVDESAPFVGTFLRSKVPDTFSFGAAELELPTRENGTDSLSGEGEVGAGEVPTVDEGSSG